MYGLFTANVNGSRVADLFMLRAPAWAEPTVSVDRILTTAAALVNAPAVRPTSGSGKPTSKDAEGDSFAKVLDAELDAADTTTTAAQPAPAPAATVVPKPAGSEVLAENTAQAASTVATGAEEAFKAALANAAPTVAPGGKAAEPAPTDAAATQTVAPSPTNSAPAAQAIQAAQTAGTAALLAAASGAVANAGKGQTDIAEGETTTTEETITDGSASATAPPSGLDALPVAFVSATNTTIVATTATTDATDRAAAAVGQAAPSLDADPASPPTAHASAQTDTNAPSQDKGAPPKAVAPQAVTQTPAASAATDVAAKAAADVAAPATGASPAPQAGPLSAAAQAPMDAARTAAIPQALQSAPAATLQVYSRIVERADGRAQRFEVRLDPAELGRVDVRIEIGADRKVHAVLAAHDSAALSDLVRGQRALERALSGAGIDLADNGLRFELASDNGRGNASHQQTHDGNSRSGQSNVWRNFEAVTVPVSTETPVATTNTWRPQRLDLVA